MAWNKRHISTTWVLYANWCSSFNHCLYTAFHENYNSSHFVQHLNCYCVLWRHKYDSLLCIEYVPMVTTAVLTGDGVSTFFSLGCFIIVNWTHDARLANCDSIFIIRSLQALSSIVQWQTTRWPDERVDKQRNSVRYRKLVCSMFLWYLLVLNTPWNHYSTRFAISNSRCVMFSM